MNSIAQNFSPINRFAPTSTKSVSVQAKNSEAPVRDGFEKSEDTDVRVRNRFHAAIVGTTAVISAAVLGAAAAVATAFAGAAVGGVCAAAALWVARDKCLPQYSVKEGDGAIMRGAKHVANGAVATVACGFVGACAAGISGVAGPIIAGVNGVSLGLTGGAALGERFSGYVFDNKPLAAF